MILSTTWVPDSVSNMRSGSHIHLSHEAAVSKVPHESSPEPLLGPAPSSVPPQRRLQYPGPPIQLLALLVRPTGNGGLLHGYLLTGAAKASGTGCDHHKEWRSKCNSIANATSPTQSTSNYTEKGLSCQSPCLCSQRGNSMDKKCDSHMCVCPEDRIVLSFSRIYCGTFLELQEKSQ